MATYKIVRKYFSDKYPSVTLYRGLTLEEAQGHCNSPDSSSKTCTSIEGRRRTHKCGPWFDAYYEE